VCYLSHYAALRAELETGTGPRHGLRSSSLQGIVYTFDNLDELGAALESSCDDQDLALPCRSGVCDGEWLLVTFAVDSDATTLPCRVSDRGGGLRLTFEPRDWDRLQRFANGSTRPSIPPACDAMTLGAISAPAGASALIVDQDPTVLSIVRAMLEACGVTTGTAHGAEEALDLLRHQSFDLVVVEPALDGMSGLELCRRLRSDEGLSALPILVLTSHTSDQDMRDALCSGADDFVGKPFRAHELRARALGLIQQARSALPAAQRA
jgi:CheY-like chemotaxis protein